MLTANAVFTESHLRSLVQMISIASHELLEMVNLNIENEQYVCAGTVRSPSPPRFCSVLYSS